MRRQGLATAVVFLVLAASHALRLGAQAPPEFVAPYTVTDITAAVRDAFGPDVQSNLGQTGRLLNRDGVVAGVFVAPGQPYRTFTFHEGVVSAWNEGLATGINSSGQVAGYFWTGEAWQGLAHAFLRDSSGVLEIGPLVPGWAGIAYGLNDNGHVVGRTGNQAGEQHAFVFRDGTFTDLGTFGYMRSDATAINNAGAIVGSVEVFDPGTVVLNYSRAYRYADGTFTDLGALGGLFSWAMDINESGQIVGGAETEDSTPSADRYRAFLFDAGVMHNLGALGPGNSWANSINSAGVIVGGSQIDLSSTLSGSAHGFIYQNGVMRDLNALVTLEPGWTIQDAITINDAGQILVYAYSGSAARTLLLTPTPRVEPASGPTAGGSVFTVSGVRPQPGATVVFGGTGATTSGSTFSTISGVTPPHTAATVDVVVTNPDASSTTLAAGFSYVAVMPSLSSVTPSSASHGGGAMVTLQGTGFQAGATVRFGTRAATDVQVLDGSTIVARTPHSNIGPVDVAVMNPDGGAASVVNGFVFTNAVPTALPRAIDVTGNETITGVLAGTDPDGDPLTFNVIYISDTGSFTSPSAAGFTSLNEATGAFTFQHQPWQPLPLNVQFRVFDGLAFSEPATITIRVHAAASAGGPLAAVMDYRNGNVAVADPRTSTLVGQLGLGLAERYDNVASPDGRAIVSGRTPANEHVIKSIDLTTRTVQASVVTGQAVMRLGFSPDYGSVYTGRQLANKDTVIEARDPATLVVRQVLGTIPAVSECCEQRYGLTHLAASPDGRWIYATTPLDLQVLSLVSGTVVARIDLGRWPGRPVFSAGGTRAYVRRNDGSGLVAVIDTSTHLVATGFPQPLWCGTCSDLTPSLDPTQILEAGTSTSGERLVRIDTQTNTAVDVVNPLQAWLPGNWPYVFGLAASTPSRVFVTSWTFSTLPGMVAEVDSAGSVVGRMTLPIASGSVFAFPTAAVSGLFADTVAAVYGTQTRAGARLTSRGYALPNKRVTFQLFGQPVGEALTDANGVAQVAVNLAGINTGAYPGAVTVSFAGDAEAPASSAAAALTISQATPAVEWDPAVIEAGTAIGAGQFNATSVVPGSFEYSARAYGGGDVPPGTPVGPEIYWLTAVFTPTDALNYISVTLSRQVAANMWTAASRPSMTTSTGEETAVDPIRNRVYVSVPAPCSSSWFECVATLEVRDGRSQDVAASVQLPYRPRAMALDVDRQRLLIAGVNQPLHVYDSASLAELETIAIGGVNNFVINIAFDGATGTAWIGGDGGTLSAVQLERTAGDPERVRSLPVCASGLGVNSTTGYVYAACYTGAVVVIDGEPSRPTFTQQVASLSMPPGYSADVAVDGRRNEIYITTTNPDVDNGVYNQVAVIDGDPTHNATFNERIDSISLATQPGQYPQFVQPLALVANPVSGRVYVKTSDWFCYSTCSAAMNVFDAASRSLLSLTLLSQQGDGAAGHMTVDPAANRVYVRAPGRIAVFDDTAVESAMTPSDSQVTPVAVPLTSVTVTFSDLTSGGTTSAMPIDAASQPLSLPGQFSIDGAEAYAIATTAGFAGSITLCFTSGVDDPDVFAGLVILHGVNGAWVPEPTTHDFVSRQLCATVSSLSPFAIGRLSATYQVQAIFDTTKAFRGGTTAPIKIRLLDAHGANISSAFVDARATRLQRISTSATAPLQDAGHANPDGNFRFDPSLGGYIYNLNLKGLAAGTYLLSVRASGDPLAKTVQFQVR